MLLWKLAEQLQERGLPVVNRTSYLAVVVDEAEITIEPRPTWCDRGNFIVKVFPQGDLALSMDEQDRFPRYYFGVQACADELAEWMRVRGIMPGQRKQQPTTTGESRERSERQ